MSGYKTIQRIRELEQQIDELGFKFSSSKHGFYEKDFGDVVTLTALGTYHYIDRRVRHGW